VFVSNKHHLEKGNIMRKMLIAVSVVCGILAGCSSPGMGGPSGSETTGSSQPATGSTAEGMQSPSSSNPTGPDYRGGNGGSQ
jgi:hypothetical protein